MNKGRLRYGANKRLVAGRHECIFIHTDFYELFAINVCGLLISLCKEQLFEIRQEYFKGMYSFPKGGEGLPDSSAIHSKILIKEALLPGAKKHCVERVSLLLGKLFWEQKTSERHTDYNSMVLNMLIKMIYFNVINFCG